ncbi:MAG TPA: hypothetical protein VFA46_20040 [Actinomycetes bacterium]|jgi:predicted RNA methylase|nr:hypothetical protein [Actinomycetes bacterium]
MAAALLSALLLLGACGGVARNAPVTDGGAGTGQQAGSADAYRQALALAAEPVSEALAGMANAKALKALTQWLVQAEQAAGRAAEQLDQVTPPQDVRAEHADLAQAFRQLNGDLGVLQDAVQGHELCASAAVMARLGKADGVAAVRDASRALAARGGAQAYRIDLPVPAAPREQSRRLPNGQFVRQGSRTGKGELTIDNSSERDTVLTLAVGKRPAFSVYVRKGSKSKVTGVRDGTYQIYYTAGVDWDPTTRAFTRDCAFERFDDAFKFTTTRTATQVAWTRWTVDLEPLRGGNAKASEVDPKDFPVS